MVREHRRTDNSSSDVNFDGGLPELNGGDGVAVVINNAAANKIDVYLERQLVYRATVDAATGQVTGTLEVTLTNTAPASGLPEVVIGNQIDQPPGTSRSLVSFYTALPVLSATRDGEPLTIETGRRTGMEHGPSTSHAAGGRLDHDRSRARRPRRRSRQLPTRNATTATGGGGGARPDCGNPRWQPIGFSARSSRPEPTTLHGPR